MCDVDVYDKEYVSMTEDASSGGGIAFPFTPSK